MEDRDGGPESWILTIMNGLLVCWGQEPLHRDHPEVWHLTSSSRHGTQSEQTWAPDTPIQPRNTPTPEDECSPGWQ